MSAAPHHAQQGLVLTVSTVGLLLSLRYGLLELRHLKFIDLHMEIVESLEAMLTEPRFRVVLR
jgi:hypothetical protein